MKNRLLLLSLCVLCVFILASCHPSAPDSDTRLDANTDKPISHNTQNTQNTIITGEGVSDVPVLAPKNIIGDTEIALHEPVTILENDCRIEVLFDSPYILRYAKLLSYVGNGGIVTVPDKVTEITSGAFGNCTAITELILPAKRIDVAEDAFEGCVNIGKATMPYSYFAFLPRASLREATINSCYGNDPLFFNEFPLLECVVSLSSFLPQKAFENCTSLVRADVAYCPYLGFIGCTALKEVNVMYSDTYWGCRAFDGCPVLEKVSLPDSAEILNSYSFNDLPALRTLEAAGVKEIGIKAFTDCGALESLVFPELEKLCLYAFYDCPSLKTLTVGENFTQMDFSPFSSLCPSFSEIHYPGTKWQWYYDVELPRGFEDGYIDFTVYCSDEVYVYSKTDFLFMRKTDYTYEFNRYSGVDKDVVIPDEYEGQPVTSIGTYAFIRSSVRSVVIPDTVKEIEKSAFSGCTDLSSIVIPDSVEYVDNDAFSNCRRLTTVVIGSSVRKIGECAFSRCRELTTVVIGSSVREIGEMAFISCEKLVHIVNKSDTVFDFPPLVRGEVTGNSLREKPEYAALFEITADENDFVNTISVDENGVETYTVGDKKYLMGFLGEGDLDLTGYDYTDIIPYAFAENDRITSIVLPGNASLPFGTFLLCQNLVSATLGEGMREIGGATFSYCTSLTSLSLPSTITAIRQYSFNECPLERLYLSPCSPEVSEEAFRNAIKYLHIYFYGDANDWTALLDAVPWLGQYSQHYTVHYVEPEE